MANQEWATGLDGESALNDFNLVVVVGGRVLADIPEDTEGKPAVVVMHSGAICNMVVVNSPAAMGCHANNSPGGVLACLRNTVKAAALKSEENGGTVSLSEAVAADMDHFDIARKEVLQSLTYLSQEVVAMDGGT
eukprot:469271-Prymnesium_polylepis.1